MISYGLSDRIITVSEYLKEFLKENKILNNERIEIVYNGVDLELFNPEKNRIVDREKIAISADELIIMTASNFRWERGHEYIIKAIEKTKGNKNNFRFVFIGNGPLENRIKSMAKDLDIEDKILFMGYRDNIHELLSLCDIFILPSIAEGVGMLSLLEPMAMKKPVITTPIGGIPEMVKNGENGFLVKPADTDAILDALYKLADDKLLRQAMGAKGRQIAEENFNARDKVRDLEKI